MSNLDMIRDSRISMEEILANTCPSCKAAPTGKCLERKHGGMGGYYWVEIPHIERIHVAIQKQKQAISKENEAA